MAWGAVKHTAWVATARGALTWVAKFLTWVFFTVKFFATNIFARRYRRSTNKLLFFFAAETSLGDKELAWRAWSFVACLLALMDSTILLFETGLGACKLSSLRNLARHTLCLLPTIALCRNTDVAGGTWAWMTEHIASIVNAVFVPGFVAVLPATMSKH